MLLDLMNVYYAFNCCLTLSYLASFLSFTERVTINFNVLKRGHVSDWVAELALALATLLASMSEAEQKH